MKKGFLILFALLIAFTLAYAGPTEDRDNRLWGGEQTFDGILQELSAYTDGTSLCFEGTTTDAYQTCLLFTDPTADRVVTFGDATFSAGATNAHTALTTITVTDTTTNVVTDLLTTSHTGGTIGNGFGTGIAFDMEDAGGVEEQGTLEYVFTDKTDAAENVDITFNQNSVGTIVESLRLVGANSATTGNRMQFTSVSSETNGVLDALVIKQAGGTIVDDFGTGISIWLENEDGDVEEKLSIAAQQTDTTNGTEDTDLVVTQFTGTTAALKETLRLVASSTATTGDSLKFTSNTTETNGLVTTPMLWLVLEETAGEGTDNIGGSIRIDLDGAAAGNEEAVGIDFILTDGGDGTEDADMVINQFVAGTVEERVRFDADDDTILLTGTTPKMTIGDGGDEDAILTFDGQTNDFYVGFDTTDDLLNIGVGSAPGTTVAIEIAADASVIIPVGIRAPFEILTTTEALAAADCGKKLFLNNAAGFVTTLPTVAIIGGCTFEFIVQTAPTSGTLNIFTNGGADVMVGHIDDISDAAGSSDNNADTLNFVNSTSLVGDRCIMSTNETSWYYNCTTGANSGITSATN